MNSSNPQQRAFKQSVWKTEVFAFTCYWYYWYVSTFLALCNHCEVEKVKSMLTDSTAHRHTFTHTHSHTHQILIHYDGADELSSFFSPLLPILTPCLPPSYQPALELWFQNASSPSLTVTLNQLCTPLTQKCYPKAEASNIIVGASCLNPTYGCQWLIDLRNRVV